MSVYSKALRLHRFGQVSSTARRTFALEAPRQESRAAGLGVQMAVAGVLAASSHLFHPRTVVKLDPFIKPALLQILLVPVHPIKRTKFERYAELIRRYDRIQLADVPADSRGERAVFSSTPTSTGTLLFDYITPTSYASHHPLAFLSDFQIHRRVHGIIGIMDSGEFTTTPIASGLAAFHSALRDLPKTFATKMFAFDPVERQLEDGRRFKEGEGLVMIPSTGDVGFYLHTVLADFASQLLWEFSNMAAQIESRVSIPTPQEPTGPPTPFTFTSPRPNPASTLAAYAGPVVPGSQSKLANSGVSAPQPRGANGSWTSSNPPGGQDGFLYGRSIPGNLGVQPTSTPSPPPGSMMVDQKSRKRYIGREKKLMADMYLLSGRLTEAISYYNDAVLMSKTWPDSVWQASALEGLCVALVLQAAGPKPITAPSSPAPNNHTSSSPGPTNAPPDPSTFLSSIPDRLSQAIGLYAKMLPPTPTLDSQPPPILDADRSHPVVYIEACLRCARFLLAVWECGGSMDRALEQLANPSSKANEPPTTSDAHARAARNMSLSPSNTVPRSSIATWIATAYGSHLAMLSLPLRMRFTGEIASLFGLIGYRRKESFVLRELAALCGESVANKSSEVLTAESSNGAATTIVEQDDENDDAGDLGASSKPSRPPPLPSGRGNDRGSIVRTTSDSAGNESIIRLAEKVCEAFGIVVAPKSSRTANKASSRMSVIQGRPQESSETGQGRFGWPALQVGVLGDAISIAEALPDYQAAIRFTVTALRTLSDSMPPAEQYRLSQNIPRIFSAATRRGAAFDLEYWGPTQLVLSLEVAPLLQNHVPTQHAYRDLEAASALTDAPTTKSTFFYHPARGPAAARSRPTVVQNEVIEVFVTLQNPFLFGLEIQSIELSTSGVPFQCDPLSTVVPPGSFHTVRLSGTPREAGLLVIRGCNIRLAGCLVREFVLPVWNDEAEAKRQKEATLDTRRERTKLSGLAAFSGTDATVPSESGLKFLECDVVPEMPLLWMRSTSLTHGALMLYDGETSTIRIGLENTSTSPVDFVKLSFADTHTSSMKAYVEEHELPAAESFEIQTDAVSRPVLEWKGDSNLSIAPGASTVIEVKCLGKVGCSHGSIQIDYGHVKRDVVKETAVFHTRQLICDVFMTVHQSLVAHSLEILRLKALPGAGFANLHARSASVTSLGRRGVALDKRLEDSLRDVDDGEHCLVMVDVLNAYGQPFEVSLDIIGEHQAVRQRLEPGATARLLVRLERVAISAEQLAQPVPSLSDRQFVVSKVKTSAVEDRRARELFWYREALLTRLRATWTEVGSLRSGGISLRTLSLTPLMLDILRADDVDIQLSITSNEAADTNVFQKVRGRGVQYTAVANEFMDLTCLVHNHSATPLRLMLRMHLWCPHNTPASHFAHLSRYVVVDGVGRVPLGVLEPGESREARVAVCLLAEGQYEFRCELEEILDEDEVYEGGEERMPRHWQAKETLAIHVEQ